MCRQLWVLVIVAIIGVPRAAEAANILGILPSIGRSHYFIGYGLMKALVDAGHNVTIVSAYEDKNAPANQRDIALPEMALGHGVGGPNLFQYKDAPNLMLLYQLYKDMGPSVSKALLSHPKVRALMSSGETFDLVIVETFVCEVLYGMAQHFKGQLMVFAPFGASMWTSELVGTPYPYSYIPHTFLSFTNDMTFWQRFTNALVGHADKFYYQNFYLPEQEILYKEYFPDAQVSFPEVMKSVRLAFVNQHFSLSFPHPYAPNMIEIGGIQIDPPKSLPKDLEEYLNKSRHGVIYFSMGSMLKGRNFPEHKRIAFINAFRQLKENVIWKYENDSLPNQPKNVFIRSWMPQNDILAHPKVKLFITHGGLLGSTEALYHGVPMVGIPIYGDQSLNLARGERAGYAVKLDYETLSEESIMAAIQKVLQNPSYKENAQRISRRYRDQPLTPAQTAVYWTEYVLRHDGAPHLQSTALKLSFVEYNLLDVYVVMALLVTMLLFVPLATLWLLVRCLRKKRKQSNEKSKKQ